jgi:hypothetical protein
MTEFFVRKIDEGMGMAVAKRTYLRPGETWADVAMRVSEGNCALLPTTIEEQEELTKAIAKASFLPAGRHLQHGDRTQKDRNIEVFSNCSTSCSSFIKFYLLLNGSGVGRMYNDDLMLINWNNMPDLMFTLDNRHKDFKEFIRLLYGMKITSILEKQGNFDKHPVYDDYQFDIGMNEYLEDVAKISLVQNDVTKLEIEDSREGWAKGLEKIEVMTYEERKNEQLVLDFTPVRESGLPIGGMQNRPASGPAPLAYALWKISLIKKNIFSYTDWTLGREVQYDLGPIEPWLQTMLIDHYASECVANGGARRSARISVKYWKDPGILRFINLKHEFVNSDGESILWSSNNSVGVDAEFWADAKTPGTWAKTVYDAIVAASYGHGTGEPGMINLDKLTANEEGV